MDNLRLILIALGLVILAVIFIFHRPGGRKQPHARRRTGSRIEPGLSADAGGDPDGEVPDDASTGEPTQTPLPDLDAPGGAPADDAGQSEPARREPGLDPAPAAPEAAGGERIVTLYLRGRNDRPISGLDLLDAAIKAGLSFGEMNIFHRRQEGATQPVFSMANISAPGSFDPSAWNLFETPGVTLFMTLPGPVSGLDAWDAMLATGRRLAELLEADLLDDSRCLLTRQRIAQIREDMREYDRRAGLAG